MAQASNFLDNSLINYLFRNITYAAPTTLAVALFTTTPTSAGGGAELNTSGGYSRLSASFGPSLTGSTANIGTLTFGPATLPWGSIVGFAVYDNISSGSGNQIVWNSMTPVTVNQGDSAQFASGSLQITIS